MIEIRFSPETPEQFALGIQLLKSLTASGATPSIAPDGSAPAVAAGTFSTGVTSPGVTVPTPADPPKRTRRTAAQIEADKKAAEAPPSAAVEEDDLLGGAPVLADTYMLKIPRTGENKTFKDRDAAVTYLIGELAICKDIDALDILLNEMQTFVSTLPKKDQDAIDAKATARADELDQAAETASEEEDLLGGDAPAGKPMTAEEFITHCRDFQNAKGMPALREVFKQAGVLKATEAKPSDYVKVLALIAAAG